MRFRSTLQRMRGIFAPVRPPRGAKSVGSTPQGDTIYEETELVPERVPVLNAKGEQVYKKHPVTGEPHVAVFKIVKRPKKVRYTIISGKHGNNWKNFHYAESPEVLAAQRRKKRRDEILEALAGRAVDMGLSTDAAVDRILGMQAAAEADPAPPPVANEEFEETETEFAPDEMEAVEVDGESGWSYRGETIMAPREKAEELFRDGGGF